MLHADEITSVEEVHYLEGKAELTVANQCMSRVADTESVDMDDSVVGFDSATHLKPRCCAGTLVMKSGPADNVLADCNEGELIHNMEDENDTSICINTSTTIVSEEETSITTNTDFITVSQERTTQFKSDFTLNEEPPTIGIRPFSVNESIVGYLSSTQSKMTRNSDLEDTYYERDRPHKPQDHQYPSTTNTIKEPVIGNYI